MAGIINTLKYKFSTSSMLMKIIFINIGVFIALRIGIIICTFMNIDESSILHWIQIPSETSLLLTRPWTIISYMFIHVDILHILFNMMWLYWFGSVFLLTANAKQMFALYIYGGVCGALAYIGAFNTFPYFAGTNGWLHGASASVIAIVAATAVRHPDYKMGLLFIGNISLKWIAIATIAIDFLSIDGSNAGGHIAHIGGAIIGVIYGLMLNRGVDITRPFNSMLDNIANVLRGISVSRLKYAKATSSNSHYSNDKKTGSRKQQTTTADDQQTLNTILDKIKKSGYTSLTAEEKKRLFDVSRRIK